MVAGVMILGMAIPPLVRELRGLTRNEIRVRLDQSAQTARKIIRRDLNRAGYLAPDSVTPLEVVSDTLVIRFEDREVRYYVSNAGLHRAQDGAGHLVVRGVDSFEAVVTNTRATVKVRLLDSGLSRSYEWVVAPRNLLLEQESLPTS